MKATRHQRLLTFLHWSPDNVQNLVDHLAAHDLHIVTAGDGVPATRERICSVICGGAS